jgi:hypothetical protein
MDLCQWNNTCAIDVDRFYKEERVKFLVCSAVFVFLSSPCGASLFAQKVELYPYAGAISPARMDDLNNNKFKSDGVYGPKLPVASYSAGASVRRKIKKSQSDKSDWDFFVQLGSAA